uniref:CSON011956 protein n=1 Tax=Culicoides sonorensis TaxID=179676 RepID=A0A336M4E2_CULSO
MSTSSATHFSSQPVTAIANPLMSSNVYGHVSAPKIASQSDHQASTTRSHIGIFSHAGQSFVPPIDQIGPMTVTNTSNQYTPAHVLTRSTFNHDLPKFDGNPNDWPTFISIYEYSTSTYCLTDQENLLRLKHALNGIALRHVSSLLTIPQNVPYVIARLRMLFGRPEQLIECQLSQIRKLPNPTLEQMTTLIDFGIAVHNLITSMQASQQHAHLNNPMLLKELIDRLSPQLRLQWIAASRMYITPNLVAFDAWLDALTLDACMVTDLITENENHRKTRNDNRRVNVHQRNHSPTDENRYSCPICDKNCKSASECDKFMNSDRNKRWELARYARLCRMCLQTHQGSCSSNQICGVDGCMRRHNKLLHPNNSKVTNPPVTTNSVEIQTESNFMHQQHTDSMLFRIIPVTLKNGSNSVNTFAFIDDGSSVTLIDQKLVTELQANGPTKPLCLQWTNNEKRMEPESKSLSLSISGQHPTAKTFEIENVRTVKDLALPTQTAIIEEMLQDWKHLKGLPLASYQNARPMILIGLDNGHLGTPLRVKEGCKDEPIATKTRLGWCIYGKIKNCHSSSPSFNAHHRLEETEITSKKLTHNLTNRQSVKMMKHENSLLSRDDSKALAILPQNTLRFKNHVSTSLIWSQDEINLPVRTQRAPLRLARLGTNSELSSFHNETNLCDYTQVATLRLACLGSQLKSPLLSVKLDAQVPTQTALLRLACLGSKYKAPTYTVKFDVYDCAHTAVPRLACLGISFQPQSFHVKFNLPPLRDRSGTSSSFTSIRVKIGSSKHAQKLMLQLARFSTRFKDFNKNPKSKVLLNHKPNHLKILPPDTEVNTAYILLKHKPPIRIERKHTVTRLSIKSPHVMPVNRTPPSVGTEPACKVCGKCYPPEECVSCEYCCFSFHVTCDGYVLPEGKFRCTSCQINFVCYVCSKTVQRDDHIVCTECPNMCHVSCAKTSHDKSFRCEVCLKEEAELVTVSELEMTTQSQLESTIKELTKKNKALESQLQKRDAQMATHQLANLSLQPAASYQAQCTPITRNYLFPGTLSSSISPIVSAVPSSVTNTFQNLAAIPKNVNAHPGPSHLHAMSTSSATHFSSQPVTAIANPLMSSNVYGHVSAPKIASQSDHQASTTRSHIGIFSHAGQSFVPPIDQIGPMTVTNTANQYTPTHVLTRSTFNHDLPKFDGNPNDWPTFISIYEYSTSTYCLTDQENLLRLKHALNGIALRHVSSLLTIPQNVPYVIARLRMLFGRPEQLIECQLSQIRKLPNPTKKME